MIAIDANILLYAYAEAAPEHLRARTFLKSLATDDSPAEGYSMSARHWL